MPPKLSIVVPIYNVEAYLDACLESLAAQTFADIQVVMVDDGSRDGSAAIAERYAAADPRFQLVRQANAGLGAARNAGVPHATGEFLAFVDSDDVVPSYAYEYLIGSLTETGSDFATGNAHRLGGYGTKKSPLHAIVFHSTRLRSHITRDKALMYDRTAWNKVFRREFWDRHALRFPEGVLYEDIAVMIPAHYLASSVDVLHEPVYLWREREGGDKSITQDRTHVKGIEDRLLALTTVRDFLVGRGQREQVRLWDRLVLADDLRLFLRELDAGDETFQHRFIEVANSYLDRCGTKVLAELPAIERLKWHLIRRRLLPEVLEVLAFHRQGLANRVVRRGLHWYGDYPFLGDDRLRIPKEIYRLGPELRLRTRIRGYTWREGRLEVDCTARIDPLGVTHPWKSPKIAAMTQVDGSRRVLMPTRSRFRRLPAARARDERYGSDRSAFAFTIDPRRLKKDGRYEDGEWNVVLGVLSRGVLRRGRLARPIAGAARRPPYGYVDDRVRMIPYLTPDGGLRVRIENVRAEITGIRVDGGRAVIDGMIHDSPPAEGPAPVLVLRNRWGGASLRRTVTPTGTGGGFTVELALADLAGVPPEPVAAETARPVVDDMEWSALVDYGRSGPVRLVLADSVAEARGVAGDRGVTLTRSRSGYLKVVVSAIRPVAGEVTWRDDGTLVLAGDWPIPEGVRAELVLGSVSRAATRSAPLVREGRAFRAVVNVAAMPTMAGVLPLPAGRWRLTARRLDLPDGAASLPIEPDQGRLAGRLPAEVGVAGRGYAVDVDAERRLVLQVTSSLRPNERGTAAQDRLRTKVYPALLRKPLRDAVLFDSYKGKQFSDNPRAIHEEILRRGLDLDLLWVVRDDQVRLPDSARAVRMWGTDWYDAVARSRYYINNMFFPQWYRRRQGQVTVQTWHGTPLKRLGYDVEVSRTEHAVLGGLARVDEDPPNWDYLVSPSPYYSQILRRAFRYDGEIIEAGYPRNDILHSPDRDRLAAEISDRIGVPRDRRIVLYAPTWREHHKYGSERYKLDLRLDLARMRAALGDDYAVLVRCHQYVVDRVPGAGDGFVWDVSDYPDIAELYLVAEVFITDYSSSMFDFANTRRPMLFFTYDLDSYRDQLRGLYFDLEHHAPGPLLRTSDEVIEAIRDVDDVVKRYQGAYDEFVARFCPLDDGKSAARVVDRVFSI